MKKIFIEAESFSDLGGWLIDQQSTLQMGSPYIMAHGLGVPVADAKTDFTVNEEGEYRIWVRARDWTSPWGELKAGKFTLLIDGQALPSTLGVNSGDWAWTSAGKIALTEGKHTLALHDLTGFNGRCDAIYLTAEGDLPPNSADELLAFRRSFICPDPEIYETEYDLIVVGGGIAGICTALAASRSGEKVLLIHDREILGGCNSSEVRVCLGGFLNLPPYDKLGKMVKEIQPILGYPTLFDKKYYEDDRKKFAFMLRESYGKCNLALGEQMTGVTTEDGLIKSIEALHIRSGKRKIYRGKVFSDCTGDATLSRMAGCEVMYGREAKDTFGESLGAQTYEKLVMGQSIRWYSENKGYKTDFPDFDTGMFKSEEDCLHVLNGDWEQETGFRRNMAEETEYIRDYGLYTIFGNWWYQKNKSERKDEYANYSLKWASHLGGKRESYRVVGDHILTQNDIENHVIYDDCTACMTWSIDIHFPEATNEEKFGEAFRSFAYHRGIVKPYPVPYRCLYARDVNNLFLGGRTVSTSHVAFSSIRVMRTLGMLGEAAGLASVICKRHNCTPREVYEKYLEEYKELLRKGVPSPNSFQCAIGSEEDYHFKDAGWFSHDKTDLIDKSPYAEKVKKNIKKLGSEYRYEGGFGEIK
jgi:hypothetical protein